MRKPEPSLLDETDPEHDARREAEADADAAAGRVVPHAEVAERLKTVGASDQQPAPYSWRKRPYSTPTIRPPYAPNASGDARNKSTDPCVTAWVSPGAWARICSAKTRARPILVR